MAAGVHDGPRFPFLKAEAGPGLEEHARGGGEGGATPRPVGPEPPVSEAAEAAACSLWGLGLGSLPSRRPPCTGFLDWVPKKMQRVGCVELLNTVQRRVQPRLHVFGHIHEGQSWGGGWRPHLPGGSHWPFSGHLPLTWSPHPSSLHWREMSPCC